MGIHSLRSLVFRSLVVLIVGFVPFVRGDEAKWYGLVEVGSTGIKVVALPIDTAGAPDLSQMVRKLPHKAVNNVTLKDLKDGKFRPEAIDEARTAVKDFYENLTQKRNVAPERIWIVASSGVTMDEPPNFDELERAVAEATGGAKKMEKIKAKEEAEHLIRGAIPPVDLRDAVLLDVGSGNIKGGYFIPPNWGPGVSRFYVIDTKLEGTVAFTTLIEKAMERQNLRKDRFNDFCVMAREQRKNLEERVDDQVGRKPGLVGRPKVYLSGGAPFVISVLTDLEAMVDERELYVKFSVEKLHKLNEALRRRNSDIPFPDPKEVSERLREQAIELVDEVRTNPVCNPPQRLLAGTEILLGLNNALRWENGSKEVYFTKSGLVAWPVGFLVKKATGR